MLLVLLIYSFNKYELIHLPEKVHSTIWNMQYIPSNSIFPSCFFCPGTNASSLDNSSSDSRKSCWKAFSTLSKLTCLHLFLLVIEIHPLYVDTEHSFKKRWLKLPTVYCQNYFIDPNSIMCDLLGRYD